MKLHLSSYPTYRLGLKKATKWTIMLFLVIITIICIIGRLSRLNELQGFRLNYLEPKVTVLASENDLLKDKLARAATYQTDPAVKKVSEYYIDKYFGKDAEIVKKVMTCESGLDNRRIHVNKDSSKDLGLYQIHDEPTHRRNIQKMYNVSLEIGSHDFEISSKYAKFLWDRNRYNWVCYRLI